MEKIIKDIAGLIFKEKAAYEQILESSENKRQALVDNDIIKLEDTTNYEAGLLGRLHQLETRRQRLVETMEKDYGLEAGTINLSYLIQKAPNQLKIDLIDLKDELKEIVGKIDAANEVNKKLLTTQQRYTNFYLNLLMGETGSGNTYDNAGSVRDMGPNRASLMDRQV